ncbi:GDNF-inducible zinc finger protein 1 [Papilio machaon]|uniref:GDNF-inducible zinc finger protein 1 n=1 Tax=Papilio machaon TaxID=76193 RepID=A0A0N1PHY6_PAPMA|nr:GDNF-inducible zinc finger protein 1 [Papilio machaon]
MNDDTVKRITCNTCLSSDREITILDNKSDLYQVYRLLISDYACDLDPLSGQSLEACWECIAILKKFNKFKQQVRTAQKHLQGISESKDTNLAFSQPLSSLQILIKIGYDNAYVEQPTMQTECSQDITTLEIVKNEPEDIIDKDTEHEEIESLILDGETSVSHIEVKIEPLAMEIGQNDHNESVKPGTLTFGTSKEHNDTKLLDNVLMVEPKQATMVKEQRKKKRVKNKSDLRCGHITEYMNEDDMLAFREEAKKKIYYSDAAYKCENCILGFYTKNHLEEHYECAHKPFPRRVAQREGTAPCKVCYSYVEEGRVAQPMQGHYVRHFPRRVAQREGTAPCKVCYSYVEEGRVAQPMQGHYVRHFPRRVAQREGTAPCKVCYSYVEEGRVAQPMQGHYVRHFPRRVAQREGTAPCKVCYSYVEEGRVAQPMQGHYVRHFPRRVAQREGTAPCKVCYSYVEEGRVAQPMQGHYVRHFPRRVAQREGTAPCKVCYSYVEEGRVAQPMQGHYVRHFPRRVAQREGTAPCKVCYSYVEEGRVAQPMQGHYVRHFPRRVAQREGTAPCKVCYSYVEEGRVAQPMQGHYVRHFPRRVAQREGTAPCKVCYSYVEEGRVAQPMQGHYVRHFPRRVAQREGTAPCKVCYSYVEEGRVAQPMQGHYVRHFPRRVAQREGTAPCKVCYSYVEEGRVAQPMQGHYVRHFPRRVAQREGTAPCKVCYSYVEEGRVAQPMQGHYVRHFPRRVAQREGTAPCKVCYSYVEEGRVSQHMQGHYVRHVCRLCGHAEATVRCAQLHAQTHVETDIDATPVKIRPMRMRRKKQNKEVQQVNEEAKMIRKLLSKTKSGYKCLYCDMHFEFSCPTCNKGYPTQEAMQDHFNYQHLGKTSHKCPICDKPIASKAYIERHLMRVHGEKKEKPKNHVCQQCGKGFTDKRSLTQHEVIHSGDRPLSCNICKQTFKQKATLYTHKKRVHNVTPAKKVVEFINDGAKFEESS